MSSKKASETAREREVFKYHQPTLFYEQADSVHFPQASRDTALTAFAQLGSLRLNARRGIISLITSEKQHIIAEGTRTISLQHNAVYEEDDGLWKGEATVPSCDDPCSVAMDLFTGRGSSEGAHLIINDLSEDDRFKNMPPVAQSPFMRFYIAVPLRSPAGLAIGIFCVIDDKTRHGVSAAELAFMKDMSLTIMAHLEAKRVKQQHKRAERMIRGIGLFVEGKSSLREWWLRTGHKSDGVDVDERVRHGESLNQQADLQFGVQELPHSLGHLADRSHLTSAKGVSNHTTEGKRILGRPVHGRDDDSMSATLSVVSSENPDSFHTKEQYSNMNSTLATSTSGFEGTAGAETITKPLSSSLDNNSGARLQEAILSTDIKHTFARASNLLRESISVEGVLLLDASVGTFGGGSTKAAMLNKAPTARDNRGTPFVTSSSDEGRKRIRAQKSNAAASHDTSQKTCGILGYSTSTRSSLNMLEASELHLSVTEEFHRKLLLRYPHGKVFNFDDRGFLSNSEDEPGLKMKRKSNDGIATAEMAIVDDAKPPQRRKKKNSRAAEGETILQILPGARCVAFFPLWDTHKERWFAGSFIWTADPTRVLDPLEDLTYLASFGNSIMAEVSRLDALVNSQMKKSFISSISHELRSPLHGILASIEFLQDSPLNHFQLDMIHTISSCSKTLLDTINHVLDFSKFKNTSEEKSKEVKKLGQNQRRAGHDTSEAGIDSHRQAANTDVGVLTEEVLEGILAGHTSRKGAFVDSSRERSTSVGSQSSSHITTQQLPIVIVDIAWRDSWEFAIDPGAWRRLIMNLFGNALKYTETGYIRVSLNYRNILNSSTMVTLTVTDSGKGISKEFLRHHLYTPFAQEDSLAVGTGLGLSIVRQIVDELRGSIDITSEQDSGTEVKVSLTLHTSQQAIPLAAADEQRLTADIQKQTRGLKACLVGFDTLPNISHEPTGILSIESKRMFLFKDSLKSLMKDWFEMEVVTSSALDSSIATVTVLMDSTFNDIISSGEFNTSSKLDSNPKSILLVLCVRPLQSYSPVVHDFYDIVYLQQPVGPHKVAKTLARYFTSKSTSQNNSATVTADDTLLSKTAKLPFGAKSASASLESLSPQLRRSISSPAPSSTGFRKDLDRDCAPSAVTVSSESIRPPSVLLVEDNAINLKLLVMYMQKLGAEYATAENGLVAVQKYKACHHFDLVFLDISMPVMDGLAAAREIRLFERESKRSRTTLIALTGAASESARQEAFSAGIDSFLTKPVPMKDLKQLIDDISQEQRLN